MGIVYVLCVLLLWKIIRFHASIDDCAVWWDFECRMLKHVHFILYFHSLIPLLSPLFTSVIIHSKYYYLISIRLFFVRPFFFSIFSTSVIRFPELFSYSGIRSSCCGQNYYFIIFFVERELSNEIFLFWKI